MPSKALDISKKIPLTSRGRLQSWDAQMSCTIESSWYSQESKSKILLMLTEKIIFFKKFIYWSEYNIEYKDFTTDRQKRKGPTTFL